MNYYERISYHPSTGAFTWKVSGRGIRIGRIAGTVTSEGYLVVKIGRTAHRAHRLAWFLTHGEWPLGEVDHINGDRLDNRIENLRVVDRSGNSQNQRRSHRDNLSCGLLGVTWNRQHRRWQAKLQARKVRHHIGYFDTPEAAHIAYLDAKKQLHIDGGCH